MKSVLPGKIDGKATAPPSKSMMQRAVAAAALAQGKTTIANPTYCEDALAAIRCASALGADVEKKGNALEITGCMQPKGGSMGCGKPGLCIGGMGAAGRRMGSGERMRESRGAAGGRMDCGESGLCIGGRGAAGGMDCGESGLCIRMFAPIAALFSRRIVLSGRGSLSSRNVGMVEKTLRELGAACSTAGGLAPIVVEGPMEGGEAEVDGTASSQFLTGLLMSLPLCGKDSLLRVKGLKSKPYVRMTLSLLKEFGIKVRHTASLDRFEIQGNQKYAPGRYRVEGDWSGASFLLVAGAIAGRVKVFGLDRNSHQADAAIIRALAKAGARVAFEDGCVSVGKGKLSGFEFDATDCPDLFPPLVALACSCEGTTRIRGAGRLGGKESDRGAALAAELGRMGAKIALKGDCMEITGGKIRGGAVDSRGDHRIAMAAAVAALASEKGAEIAGAQCVAKSYPQFFEDLEGLRVK